MTGSGVTLTIFNVNVVDRTQSKIEAAPISTTIKTITQNFTGNPPLNFFPVMFPLLSISQLYSERYRHLLRTFNLEFIPLCKKF